MLTWLRDLFGLGLIEKHLAWYLINGRLSAQRAAAVSSYIDRLCLRLRPHAQDLVDAFGYAPEHLRAPIASGAEQARQDEAREYYRALAESGRCADLGEGRQQEVVLLTPRLQRVVETAGQAHGLDHPLQSRGTNADAGVKRFLTHALEPP